MAEVAKNPAPMVPIITANSMDSKYIQKIIVSKRGLICDTAKYPDNTSKKSDDQCSLLLS